VKWSLILIAVAILQLNACSQSTPKGAVAFVSPKAAVRTGNIVKFDTESPQLSRIQCASVEYAKVPVDEISAPGKVEMISSRVSHVALPVSGKVRRVLAVVGDSVVQGQTLVVVESPEISETQSALRQSEANIAQAKAQVAKAEADFSRAQDLFANKAIAQKEVLAAETILQQHRAELDEATASRDEALRKLTLLGLTRDDVNQLVDVRSPTAGKVIDLSIVAGEYRNDTSTPVMTIADLSTVLVTADVPETSIRFIRLGEQVSISLPAFPDREFRGTVNRIADLVDPQTRTIKVKAVLENSSGQLRPEMFATIRHSQGFQVALVVPKSALFQQQDRTTVFLERSHGEFEEITVTVFWQDNTRAAVQGALHRGDHVVVDGVAQLRAY